MKSAYEEPGWILDIALRWLRAFTAAVSARATETLPAAGLAVSVTMILCGLQLMPFGKGMLLVRVHDKDLTSAIMAAAEADVAFVGVPAQGFAIVYGQASKVRAALGLAVSWKGNAPCSPRS